MINSKTTLEEIGAIVCQALKDVGIESFLSGGAVVSIYTANRYESYDLDFVTFGDRKKIKTVMERLGFVQDKSRLFRHPKTSYMVEFPGTATQIGEEPIRKFARRVVDGKVLRLLTPTDCVKDRLAAYIHWHDNQGLEQASLVASQHPVKLSAVAEFCRKEGSIQAYESLRARLKELGKSK